MTWPADDRVLAVLETSFWIAAHRADVAANCLDLFDIVVPRHVEAEILSVQADTPRREYPYATLFRHLRDKMLNPPSPGPTPLAIFGLGEAEAIAIARQSRAVLLINERPAARHAVSLGVRIVTVPTVILTLR